MFRRKNAKNSNPSTPSPPRPVRIAESNNTVSSVPARVPQKPPSAANQPQSPVRIRQEECGSPQRTGSFHLENIVAMVDITQPVESPTLTMAALSIQPTHSLETKPVSLTPSTERASRSQPTSPVRSASPTHSSPKPDELAAFQKKLIDEANRISQANDKVVQEMVEKNTVESRRIQTRVTYEADRIHSLLDKLSDEYSKKEETFFKALCCCCDP